MASARRGVVAPVTVAIGMLGLWGFALAGPAGAALPSNCVQSGNTVTCKFVYAGTEQTLSVPAGQRKIHVAAVGGTGGINGDGDAHGGYGGTISGDVAVKGGSTLYIEVGGNGSNTGKGGFSGGTASGGAGGSYQGADSVGGGGGGASVVQTCSAKSSSCTTKYFGSSEPRLVVAGGGAGGGGYDGCVGGSGGGGVGPTAGQDNQCGDGGGGGKGTGGSGEQIVCPTLTFSDGGGGGATLSAPGTGGNSNDGLRGAPGSGATGGNGYTGTASSSGGGGGGGGGYYGGGGGGASHSCGDYGFGGGAGSSYAKATNAIYGNDTTATPSVTISYQLVPVVSTGRATKRKSTSARLNGKVNPNGSATKYYFQYGTSKRYGKRTAARSAGSGTTLTSVSAFITGLKPHRKYHFRIVAVNAGGKAVGADRTFTTAAAAAVKPAKPPFTG